MEAAMNFCLHPSPSEAAFDGASDGTLRPGGLRLTEEMIGRCGFPSGAAILDVGCGVGSSVAFLRHRYRLDACGVDISPLLISRGAQLHPAVPLVQGAAEALPFRDEIFDGVIAECSLSVAGLTPAVVASLLRVLRPDGFLLVSDVYIRHPEAAGTLPPLLTQAQWTARLEAGGFSMLDWVDRSDLLAAYVAKSMMSSCAADALWCGLSANPAVRKARPGYFYLLAQKGSAS